MAKSSVKFMLTAREKQELHGLGYYPEEVEFMKIEMATAILSKGLKRPWGERPMPDAWRKGADAPPGGGGGGLWLALGLLGFAAVSVGAFLYTEGHLDKTLERLKEKFGGEKGRGEGAKGGGAKGLLDHLHRKQKHAPRGGGHLPPW